MKTADEIIDALGGTGAVAEICGLTTGAISQWRGEGKYGRRYTAEEGIPKPWLMFFEQRNPELFEKKAA